MEITIKMKDTFRDPIGEHSGEITNVIFWDAWRWDMIHAWRYCGLACCG